MKRLKVEQGDIVVCQDCARDDENCRAASLASTVLRLFDECSHTLFTTTCIAALQATTDCCKYCPICMSLSTQMQRN